MRTEARSKVEPVATDSSPIPGSFEHFFLAQFPVLVRIAYGVVRDAHQAEDVAQEVLISAEKRFSEPYSTDHAIAWARVAATHLALNAVRSRKRRDAREQSSTQGPGPAGPEELVLGRGSGAAVRDALSRLPRHSATVLVLRHSGLSYAEVAQAMGVNTGHIGTMLRRAEAALRKELQNAPHF